MKKCARPPKRVETSKEELQSTNEELITVNIEMKSKMEETDKSHRRLAKLRLRDGHRRHLH